MTSKITTALTCTLTALAISASGCTFYTACPTPNPNTGGTNGSPGGAGGGNTPITGIVDGAIPPGDWTNVMPDTGDLESNCGPVAMLVAYPGRDEIIGGIFSGLWSTRDGGTSWAKLGEAEGSVSPLNGATGFAFDPVDQDTYWEAGIYGVGGVYKTTDGGEIFSRVSDLLHIESVSVDFSDPERKAMLTSGHETQLLRLSLDGGDTWEDITDRLPEGVRWCRYSLILDSSTFLLGCGGGGAPGSTPAVVMSEDGGETWRTVFEQGGGAPPLWHSDGTVYWPLDITGGLAVSKNGTEKWESRPQPELLAVPPVELPDGRIASVTASHVVISDDGGTSWKNATPTLPWKPITFTYAPLQKAFFIGALYPECKVIPIKARGDEIMRFDFDYEKY